MDAWAIDEVAHAKSIRTQWLSTGEEMDMHMLHKQKVRDRFHQTSAEFQESKQVLDGWHERREAIMKLDRPTEEALVSAMTFEKVVHRCKESERWKLALIDLGASPSIAAREKFGVERAMQLLEKAELDDSKQSVLEVALPVPRNKPQITKHSKQCPGCETRTIHNETHRSRSRCALRS